METTHEDPRNGDAADGWYDTYKLYRCEVFPQGEKIERQIQYIDPVTGENVIDSYTEVIDFHTEYIGEYYY